MRDIPLGGGIPDGSEMQHRGDGKPNCIFSKEPSNTDSIDE